MSNTVVSCTRATHPVTKREVHVVGYQNQAQSPGPNCMILPFPTKSPMGPENVLDTSSMKSVLNDYKKAVKSSKGASRGIGSRGIGAVQVFSAGSYTVLLTDDASLIESALDQIPKRVRPQVRKDLLDFLSVQYPHGDWSLALCCWEGEIDAEPLMWWYEPTNPDLLFFPGMDAHSGGPPEYSVVERDHVLVHNCVGERVQRASGRSDPGVAVHYSDPVDERLKPYLSLRVGGFEFQGMYQNGDWVLDTRTGELNVIGFLKSAVAQGKSTGGE